MLIEIALTIFVAILLYRWVIRESQEMTDDIRTAVANAPVYQKPIALGYGCALFLIILFVGVMLLVSIAILWYPYVDSDPFTPVPLFQVAP